MVAWLRVTALIISSPFSEGKMLRYAVQMLRSGLIFTRVTLTITPCIMRVCDWKIRLNSFCSSRAMRFCLVSCIVCIFVFLFVSYVFRYAKVHIFFYSAKSFCKSDGMNFFCDLQTCPGFVVCIKKADGVGWGSEAQGSVGLEPVAAPSEVCDERHGERVGVFHFVYHDFLYDVFLRGRNGEVEFVVNLEYHL